MFVIYKENLIPGVGGVHPQGIQTGLAVYNDWVLAECPTDKIHNYKEYNFIAVNNEVSNGLILLDGMIEETEDSEALAPDNSPIVFSDKDESDMEEAKKFINNIELKLITRAKVREIKDIEDDLVDLKKMVQSLVSFSVADWETKSQAQKDASKFGPLMDNLKTALSENRSSITTVDNDLEKLESVIDLEVEIAKVVDNYYFANKL
jgi:hypothetical protein